jgi:membrane-associated progesterone receptor component
MHGCFSYQSKKEANIISLRTVFAGHDASRALALTSTKAEDVRPDWEDLSDKEKGVLNDWNTFFSKRYNVVGWVEGATNKGA